MVGSVELNLPLTCQQPSAMLDSSEGSIFKLLFLRIKRIVRPSKKQKSAMELNDKQPLNTINENLNQSNYEQLNLEESPKQSYSCSNCHIKGHKIHSYLDFSKKNAEAKATAVAEASTILCEAKDNLCLSLVTIILNLHIDIE
ncbi:hypothetical protein C2G38_2180224 [Gigaspora rosea]|uniref:Uncharacterized protein n=1 Tax=Gigaspora rosea TaxID=44941 RepID=A0A397VDZ9_9GLOM|nr:hypothetical protein C2G38_2180224 [Gigaspora rosea]